MPIVSQEVIGFWGERTASIDWCESNYEVTEYVAEFWNTVSNLSMIIPPLYGIWNARKYRLETRYYLSHFMLLLVGIGSTMFHMTLKYSMQLMDELPMIYGSCVFIYCMAEVRSGPRDKPVWLVGGLFLYAFLFTAIYSVWQNPLVHEFLNAFLIAVLFFQAFMLLRNHYNTGCARLFILGTIFYAAAFLAWNIDNHFCGMLQKFRAENPLGLGVVSQLHALWHILAGYATYLHILFSTHYRLQYLQRKPEYSPCLVGIEVVKGLHP